MAPPGTIDSPDMLPFLKEGVANRYTAIFINVSAIVARFVSDKRT